VPFHGVKLKTKQKAASFKFEVQERKPAEAVTPNLGERGRTRFLGRGARRPGHAGLDAMSFNLTVYVKERGPGQGQVDAAATTGQHPVREPKNGGKIADRIGVSLLTLHDIDLTRDDINGTIGLRTIGLWDRRPERRSVTGL